MGSSEVAILLQNMACQLNDSRLLDCEQGSEEIICESHIHDAAVSCLGGIKS